MNVSVQPFKDNRVMESREREQEQQLKSLGLTPHFSNRQNVGETSIHIHKDCEKQVLQILNPM